MLDLRYVEQQPNHRRTLVRRAVLLAPLAIVMTGVLLYAIASLPSSIVMVIIVGIGTIAVDVEAIAALRDLRSRPVSTRGVIGRIWKKSRYLFLGRVDYMLIGHALFEISAIAATELQAGDEVIVEHWPHSNLVISIDRAPLKPPPPPPPAPRFGLPERP